MKLTRCFQQGRVVAYAIGSPYLYAVIMEVASGESVPDEQAEATEVFRLWGLAPAGAGGRRRRAIHFFPSTDLAGAVDLLGNAVRLDRWGYLYYWTNTDAPKAWFPSGQANVAGVRQWRLRVKPADGEWPRSLDDLSLAWSDGEGRLVVASNGEHWTLDDGSEPLGSPRQVSVDLSPGARLGYGGIRAAVERAGLDRLPVQFSYHTVEEDDEEFSFEVAMSARALEERAGRCDLVLDPRDETDFRATPMTRLEFHPGAMLVANFVSDEGLRAVLRVPGPIQTAIARLRHTFTGGVHNNDGPVPSIPGEATFALEGDFVFAGLKQTRSIEETTARPACILMGHAPTEVTHVRPGDVFRFAGRQPGALRPIVDGATAKRKAGKGPHWLDDYWMLATASWLSIVPGTEHPASDPPSYRSEPSASPLFKGIEGSGGVLERARPEYGTPVVPMPVFPWAGRIPSVKGAKRSQDKSADYETTHLAPARRMIVTQQRTKRADADPQRTVTPQGLIASLNAGGHFDQLLFGRPSDVAEAAEEFSVRLVQASGNSEAYEDLQRALRAEDLFLVVGDASVEARGAFKPSSRVTIRGFSVELDLDPKVMGASVLMIKYFRGKSLSELVEDPDLWSCKKHLARTTTSEQIKEIANRLTAGEVGFKEWREVWTRPDWQGVVLLDFPPTGTPSLFEALGAGMNENQFRFHHLGLNFLPVRAGDLRQDATPRVGSSFGLLRYKKRDNAPDQKATAIDHEPGGPPPPGERSYAFTVDKLAVLLQNSQIRGFDAQVRVGFSHLLWDKTEGGDANQITLKGSYEARTEAGGGTSDLFKLVCTESPSFAFAPGSWLESFTVSAAELSVTGTAGGGQGRRREITFFVGINGELKFRRSNQAFREFFELERLSIERGGLEFKYRPSAGAGTVKEVECGFRADGMRAGVKLAEGDSFLSLLPMRVTGFRAALGELLDLRKLNFVPLAGTAPDFLFAVEFEIDMGFVGKLAGAAKGLRFPALLGWRRGAFGFGIQFPNWNGESFEIGIQQFVGLRAEGARVQHCRDGNRLRSIALAFWGVRFVLFGREWPQTADLSMAVFVPVGSGGKLAWLAGVSREGSDWPSFIGAAHRVGLPPGAGGDAKSIVKACRKAWSVEIDDDHPEGVCQLQLPYDSRQDGWVVATNFKVAKLADVWLALADSEVQGVYALLLELPAGLTVGASYRRVNDQLGVYSAQLKLDPVSSLQVGAATVRLPMLRTEVFTDGGWVLDLGYPWDRDYRNSFQMEVAIFVGAGGLYIGYTSASAVERLKLEGPAYGYEPPQADFSLEMRAVRIGIALRVGVGRSVDLGILKGEVSITLYGTLEGAGAFRPNSRDLELFAIRGTTGLLVHIWAELDFVVLQARAEIKAYVEFGFELRRVLARQGDQHVALELPFKVFAEVGISLHFEVWVTLGCVRVKLFDLTFSATWRIEETFGSPTPHDLPPKDLKVKLAAAPAARRLKEAWTWPAPPDEPQGPLTLYVTALPAAADPGDLGLPDAGRYEPCVVGQLLLRIGTDFRTLAEYMITWVLGLKGERTIERATVKAARQALRSNDHWHTQSAAVLSALVARFRVGLVDAATIPEGAPREPGEMDLGGLFVPVPTWPGVTVSLAGVNPPTPKVLVTARGFAKSAGVAADAADHAFVDFVRLVTETFLAEVDRILGAKFPDAPPEKPGSLPWDEVWDALVNAPRA